MMRAERLRAVAGHQHDEPRQLRDTLPSPYVSHAPIEGRP